MRARRTLTLLALMLVAGVGALPADASGSPDPAPAENGRIVFVGNGWVGGYPTGTYQNTYLDIFSTDESGRAERLTQTTPVLDGAFNPEASPDGRWIAYGEWSGAENDSDLMLIRSDGSDRKTLLGGPGDARDPSWSPDGRKIVFRSHPGLAILRLSTGRVTRLAMNSGGIPVEPKWSPDGSRIAFELGEAIYTVRPDGSGLRRVTGLPRLKEGGVDWSPDGRWIVFQRTRAAEPGIQGVDPDHLASDIWIARADGSGERNLTDSGGTLYEEAPAWSPDGRKIAFVRGTGDRGAWDIWVMTRQGKEQKRVFGFDQQHAESNQIYWLDWAPQPR